MKFICSVISKQSEVDILRNTKYTVYYFNMKNKCEK